VLPTAQAEISAPEAALAHEIRIDKRDRVIAAPARDITRYAMIIITSALLFALVLYFGWIGGFNSDFFTIKPPSLPVEKGSADLPDAAKSDRLALQGSSANTTVGSVHEISKRSVQATGRPLRWNDLPPEVWSEQPPAAFCAARTSPA
jgi:hypothetical protein